MFKDMCETFRFMPHAIVLVPSQLLACRMFIFSPNVAQVAYDKAEGDEETLIMTPGMCIGVPAGVRATVKRSDS